MSIVVLCTAQSQSTPSISKMAYDTQTQYSLLHRHGELEKYVAQVIAVPVEQVAVNLGHGVLIAGLWPRAASPGGPRAAYDNWLPLLAGL